MSENDAIFREELDDAAYQIREVYAQYGLTSYCSQTAEKGLLNVLAVALTARSEMPTQGTFDKIFKVLSRLTFGQLVDRFNTAGIEATDVAMALKRAVPVRNFITHRFFWDRAAHFLTFAGREEMLIELAEARDQFERLEGLLTALVRRIVVDAGLDLEGFEKQLLHEAEKLRAGAPAD